MANLNNIIAKVASVIGDKMDGDTVMLIDQHMPNALKATCKFVAETKPVGHERLLLEQTKAAASISIPAGGEYNQFALSTLTYVPVIPNNRFHRFTFQHANGIMRGYNVRTMSGLSLAGAHGVCYYFIEPPYIFLNAPTTELADIVQVIVTDYVYATISQFPDELEDLLVTELIRLISHEEQKQLRERQEINE